MLNNSVPETGDTALLVLLSLSSGAIYALPVDTFRGAIRSGSTESDEARGAYVDLQACHMVLSISEDLTEYRVPDAELSEVLRLRRISGLQADSTPAPAGSSLSLPFFGNLTDPSWLSICMGGRCDSRCKFCFTEWIRAEPQLSLGQIQSALDEASPIGTLTSVVFSGGEPTLRSELPSLIAYASALGFHEIGLQTNGHRMANEAYVRRLARAGLTSALISLHGSKAVTHDSITGHVGSFEKARRGILLAATLLADTEVNFVVCKGNLAEAAELVALVSGWPSTVRLRFSFPIIEGAAYDHAGSIVPEIAEFVAVVSAAKLRADRAGLGVSVANVPPCVSDAIGVPPTYLISQRQSMLGLSSFYSAGTARGEVLAKLAACDGCPWFDECGGLQVAYLAAFPKAYAELDHVRALTRDRKAVTPPG